MLKFWKKVPLGLEFVKLYRAHLGPLVAMAVSADGLRLATCGDDGTCKFFDVLSFDMIDLVKLDFYPAAMTVRSCSCVTASAAVIALLT